MKNLFLLVSISILVAIPNMFSQNNLSVHLGPSIPIAKYGRFNPGIGLTAGLLYSHAISEKRVGWFVGVDVHYSDTPKYLKDDFFENAYETSYSEVTFSKYLNLPISTGLTYSSKLSDNVVLFSSLGVVFNFLKITDFNYHYTRYDYEESYSGDSSYKFDVSKGTGFKLSAGVQYNKIIFKLNYLSAWQEDVLRAYNFSGSDSTHNSNIEVKVDIITLTLGYKFL